MWALGYRFSETNTRIPNFNQDEGLNISPIWTRDILLIIITSQYPTTAVHGVIIILFPYIIFFILTYFVLSFQFIVLPSDCQSTPVFAPLDKSFLHSPIIVSFSQSLQVLMLLSVPEDDHQTWSKPITKILISSCKCSQTRSSQYIQFSTASLCPKTAHKTTLAALW